MALSGSSPAGDQRRAGVGRQRAQRRGRCALRVPAPRRVLAAARGAREAQVGGARTRAAARTALPRRRRLGRAGALLRRRRHQGTPRRPPHLMRPTIRVRPVRTGSGCGGRTPATGSRRRFRARFHVELRPQVCPSGLQVETPVRFRTSPPLEALKPRRAGGLAAVGAGGVGDSAACGCGLSVGSAGGAGRAGASPRRRRVALPPPRRHRPALDFDKMQQVRSFSGPTMDFLFGPQLEYVRAETYINKYPIQCTLRVSGHMI